jgi:hypothetical protein
MVPGAAAADPCGAMPLLHRIRLLLTLVAALGAAAVTALAPAGDGSAGGTHAPMVLVVGAFLAFLVAVGGVLGHWGRAQRRAHHPIAR